MSVIWFDVNYTANGLNVVLGLGGLTFSLEASAPSPKAMPGYVPEKYVLICWYFWTQ